MKPTLRYFTALLPAAAIVLMLLTHLGCNTGNNTPSQAARNFFTAFQQKNFAKAKKYATTQSMPMLDMMTTLGEKAPKPSAEDEKADFSLKTLSESESAATVQVVLPDNQKAIVMQLEKENGFWKVAFDKSLD